jgi:AMMECR1 domain-containing protein
VPSPEQIEMGRHGVVLSKGGRRAVFLPQVATETGWDRDRFLSQLSLKAGLSADAWREGARFEVFTAQVFGEEE